MDRRAMLWANRLLGNRAGAPVLEVTLGGLEVKVEVAVTIALTGADCSPTVDGAGVGSWRPIQLQAGQTLRLGFASRGMRANLAFPGGVRAPTFFDSASVVLREGLSGGKIVSGFKLEWAADSRLGTGQASPPSVSVPPRFRNLPGPETRIQFLPGYEWAQFSEADRAAFVSATWAVTPASDRIATRLEGPALTSGPRSLDSAPLVDGTIQVTADGAPLVFMRDRPTIGGYPKLGSILPHLIDELAQARPGTLIRFEPGDAQAAREEMRRQNEFFRVG